MAIELTTEEAEQLIKVLKIAEENGVEIAWKYFVDQEKYRIELIAISKEVESDIKFKLVGTRRNKLSYQMVLNGVNIGLLRIDNSEHTNPDGSKISGVHIHLYKQGYGDKWAYKIDSFDLNDPHKSFLGFLHEVNFDKSTIKFNGSLL